MNDPINEGVIKWLNSQSNEIKEKWLKRFWNLLIIRFKTESEALRDMDKKISEGKVLYYEEIKEIKWKTLF